MFSCLFMKQQSMMKWRVRRDSRCDSVDFDDVRKSLEVLDNVLAEYDDGDDENANSDECQDEQLASFTNVPLYEKNGCLKDSKDIPPNHDYLHNLQYNAQDGSTKQFFEELQCEQLRKFSPPPVPKRSPATRLSNSEKHSFLNAENIISPKIKHKSENECKSTVKNSSSTDYEIMIGSVENKEVATNFSFREGNLNVIKNTDKTSTLSDDEVFLTDATENNNNADISSENTIVIANKEEIKKSLSVSSLRSVYEKKNDAPEREMNKLMRSSTSASSISTKQVSLNKFKEKLNSRKSPVLNKKVGNNSEAIKALAENVMLKESQMLDKSLLKKVSVRKSPLLNKKIGNNSEAIKALAENVMLKESQILDKSLLKNVTVESNIPYKPQTKNLDLPPPIPEKKKHAKKIINNQLHIIEKQEMPKSEKTHLYINVPASNNEKLDKKNVKELAQPESSHSPNTSLTSNSNQNLLKQSLSKQTIIDNFVNTENNKASKNFNKSFSQKCECNEDFEEMSYLLKKNQVRPLDRPPPIFNPPPPPPPMIVVSQKTQTEDFNEQILLVSEGCQFSGILVEEEEQQICISIDKELNICQEPNLVQIKEILENELTSSVELEPSVKDNLVNLQSKEILENELTSSVELELSVKDNLVNLQSKEILENELTSSVELKPSVKDNLVNSIKNEMPPHNSELSCLDISIDISAIGSDNEKPSLVSHITDTDRTVPTDIIKRPPFNFSYSLEEDLSPGIKEIITSTPKSDHSELSPKMTKGSSSLSTFSQSFSSLGYGSSQSDIDLNISLQSCDKIPVNTIKSQTLPVGAKLSPSPFYSSDNRMDPEGCENCNLSTSNLKAELRSSSAPPLKHLGISRWGRNKERKKKDSKDKNQNDDNLSFKSDLSLDENIIIKRFSPLEGSTESKSVTDGSGGSTSTEEKSKKRSVWKSIIRRK